MNKKNRVERLFAFIILLIASLSCVVPLMMIVSASFSNENELLKYGYSPFPRGFTLEAYKIVFINGKQLLRSYLITIFVTIVGTFGATFVASITAYPLSRTDFKWRNKFNFYFYFTMLFSGGMIPSYILISQYLHLRDNILVLIIPSMFNVWNMFVLRNSFSQINPSVIESAKIDGASEYRIFASIAFPMTQVGIATIAFLSSMSYWNDWLHSFMYMSGNNISLQYFLQRTMQNVEQVIRLSQQGMADAGAIPGETARMAMCVLAVGPMLFAFMYFQKYFSGGISVGAVKG